MARLLLFAVLLTIVSSTAFAGDKDSLAKTVKTAVEEDGKEADEAKKALADEDASMLSTQLAKYLADKATKEKALRLATELRAFGLWKHVKEMLDEEKAQLCIDYAVATNDESAIDDFLKKWLDEKTDGDLRDRLELALIRLPLDKRALSKVEDAIKTDALEASAKSILFSHFGMTLTELEEFDKGLVSAKKRWKDESRRNRISGIDLLKVCQSETNAVSRAAKNHRIGPSGTIEQSTFPKKAQSGNWAVTCKVYVPKEGDDGSIGINVGNGIWTVKIEGKTGFVETGRGVRLEAPLKRGAWNTIVFSWTDKSVEGEKYNRRGHITLNGQEVLKNGTFSGILTGLTVRGGKSGLVIGGVSLDEK